MKKLLVSAFLLSAITQTAMAENFVGSIKHMESTSKFTRISLNLVGGGSSPEVVIAHGDEAQPAQKREFSGSTIQNVLDVYLSDPESNKLVLKTTTETQGSGYVQHYAHTFGVKQVN